MLFLILRHNFKMPAMTSARRSMLHVSVGCQLARRACVMSLPLICAPYALQLHFVVVIYYGVLRLLWVLIKEIKTIPAESEVMKLGL